MKSADALTAEILAPLAQGRGIRVGCVGITGSGKSFALREIVKRASVSLDVVLVHDDSEDAGKWGGQIRRDLTACRDRPATEEQARDGSPVIVLTGDPFARVYADPEASAREAWRLAARGWKTAVVCDELKRAADGQRWRVREGDLPRVFSEGRKPGISGFWGTQNPQEIPREPFGQSELLLFGMDGREAEYLRRISVLDDAQAERIPRLKNGEFMVRLLGRPRSTDVYRY